MTSQSLSLSLSLSVKYLRIEPLSKITFCKLCHVLVICDSEDFDSHSLILYWGAIEA